MSEQIILGGTAVVLGVVIGLALFVPFVTISFRRRGGLSLGRFVLWAAALVYFFAIWTYTLLPLPSVAELTCANSNLNLFEFVNDIRSAIARPGNKLTDPAVLQLGLNVLLFMPLGFFVRVLSGRGVVTALLIGLGVSLFIETTQLTGVWGMYPCAYRVFDVDDVMTNTTGAAIGALLSLIVPDRYRGMAQLADAGVPRPVTKGRRLLAMLCDALIFAFASAVVAIGTHVSMSYVAEGSSNALDSGPIVLTTPVVPAALWLVIIISTGRSVGDLAVQLRYSGGPLPVTLRRGLRWVGGISAYPLLASLPRPWSLAAGAFLVVAIVLVFTTKGGRGIPGLLSGTQLDDARAPDARAPGENSDARRETVPDCSTDLRSDDPS